MRVRKLASDLTISKLCCHIDWFIEYTPLFLGPKDLPDLGGKRGPTFPDLIPLTLEKYFLYLV